MNKINVSATAIVLLLSILVLLCSCGRKSDVSETPEPVSTDAPVSTAGSADTPETGAMTAAELSDEQALSAIKNYCYSINPDLESIVNSKEYPVYWEIASSDEHKTVVLFRSYTGVLVRYYIDCATGETYSTEFVPGITAEEQRTDESFNINDYFSED